MVFVFDIAAAKCVVLKSCAHFRAGFDEFSIVQGLDINEFSRGKIDASTGELAEERDAVKDLGLI